jgi:hypothetical protein
VVFVCGTSYQCWVPCGQKMSLLLSLIETLFPGLRANWAHFPGVSRALEKMVLDQGLQLHGNWLNKCIQLWHGIMLVAASSGGPELHPQVLGQGSWGAGHKACDMWANRGASTPQVTTDSTLKLSVLLTIVSPCGVKMYTCNCVLLFLGGWLHCFVLFSFVLKCTCHSESD